MTFGSFLLLAGRLGDLFGRKRVFISGVIVFTAASVLCGLAPSQAALIGARFLQGIGAAMQASVILAIIATEFPKPSERARAMSGYVFVAVAGGSLGLLAGGLLTQALSWHWIFFVNLPIGAMTVVLGRRLIPVDEGVVRGRVDWLGSVLDHCLTDERDLRDRPGERARLGINTVLGFGALGATLLAAFAAYENRIENPILPLRILRVRGLVSSSVVRGFLVTGMYSTFFLGTLYLEHVLRYGALQTGLAFLPWTLTVAALSLGLTARLVERFGVMRVMIAGMLTVIVGLGLLTTVDAATSFFPTIFLAYFTIGLGIGAAFMPLLTIAMADIPAADAGIASGIVNVSQQVAGALGLAVLGTIATNRTHALAAAHHSLVGSLLAGYHLAFAIGAVCVAIGIVAAIALLQGTRRARAGARGRAWRRAPAGFGPELEQQAA